MANDSVDRLYDALHADGAVRGTREQFRSYFLANGDNGYQNRLKLYKALKADGAVTSATYEEFRDKMGLGPVRKQPQTKPAPQQSNLWETTSPIKGTVCTKAYS